MNLNRPTLLTIVTALVLLPIRVCAAEADAGVASLLDLGAKGTTAAVAAGREQYEALKRASPSDPRIDYAYGLVLANQRRYADAIPFVAKYLNARQDDHRARRVQMWAQLEERQHPQVIEAVIAEAKRLPKSVGSEPPAAAVETAEFLGTVLGYLELVRPAAIDREKLTTAKNQVLEILGSSYLEALDSGRAIVASRLAQLNAARDARQQKAEAVARQQQTEAQTALNGKRDQVTAEENSIEFSAEQLQDAQRKLNVLRGQLNSLGQDRLKLSAQITWAQALLTEVLRPVDLGQIAGSSTDPIQRRVTRELPVTDPRYARAAALSTTLASLNRQAFELDRRIFQLQAQADELSNQGQDASRAIAQSEAAIHETQKRASALERRLQRIKPGESTRKSIPRTDREARFSTYLPYPYEQEKARVLAWFSE